MKLLLVISLLFSQIALAKECDKVLEKKICIELNWLEGPHIDAFSTVEITLSNYNNGELLDIDKLNLYPWMVMDGHEHGSMDVLIEKVSPGKFIIDEIYFFSGMEGIWQLKLENEKNYYVIFELD
jgi:hypothetical protein